MRAIFTPRACSADTETVPRFAIEFEKFALRRVALTLLLLVVVFVALVCELPLGWVPEDEAAPFCGAVAVEEATDAGQVLSLTCATPFAFVAEGFAPECC
jgi:hypothetical protein